MSSQTKGSISSTNTDATSLEKSSSSSTTTSSSSITAAEAATQIQTSYENLPPQIILQIIDQLRRNNLNISVDTVPTSVDHQQQQNSNNSTISNLTVATQDENEGSQFLNFENNNGSASSNSCSSGDHLGVGADDPYYQTVIEIYTFFKQKVPVPVILNAIHQSAGDLPRAVQRLSHNVHKTEEPCDFSYHKICAPKEQIEAYFTY